MTSYANQRHITTHKTTCKDGKPYVSITVEDFEYAAKDLNHATFKLWLYFAKNKDGYGFYSSFVAIEESIGISRNQYYNSFKELIEKGYLVETSSNHYAFYESPQYTSFYKSQQCTPQQTAHEQKRGIDLIALERYDYEIF